MTISDLGSGAHDARGHLDQAAAGFVKGLAAAEIIILRMVEMTTRRILKTGFGDVEERLPYEPAPLRCEGTCGSTTMHIFAGHRRPPSRDGMIFPEHDIYACTKCEHERVWG